MNDTTFGLWLADENSTQYLGYLFAQVLVSPARLYLQGEIGAGKTTLVRAILKNLGVTGAVKSPSFAIIESYELPELLIYHFDLYRLTDPEELEYLAWRDHFAETAICCVEWPERAAGVLPQPDIAVNLVMADSGRQAICTAFSSRGHKILNELEKLWSIHANS